MRKIILSVALTIGMIGATFAQLAIPGEVFGDNPQRFNGRKVTIKNIQLKSEVLAPNQLSVSPSTAINLNAAPGAIGTPTAPNVIPCRAPRGFSAINVIFKAKPDYKGCFFMADAMKKQLDRELGGQTVDAQITFRGDYRTGYNVSFYKLGM